MKIALTIAGSDSGGGAGIQADLKTFHQFGVFGTSVLVAVTAQNTLGVSGVHVIPAETVEAQLTALVGDLPPHAVKTGMLATAEMVAIVAEGIRRNRFGNYVLDPVMVAASGDRLLTADAETLIMKELVPLATLVTPNLDEAEILVQDGVRTVAEMEQAGRSIVRQGACAALIKGGHLESEEIVDVLVTADEVHEFRGERIASNSTHGTGCTLSSGIVANLALGHGLRESVQSARDFVQRAIESAPGLGRGRGPLNHLAQVTPPP